jgi:hypothetical protein
MAHLGENDGLAKWNLLLMVVVLPYYYEKYDD